MNPYDHTKIEKKWQKYWEKKKLFNVKENPKQKKFYALIEFPYPSGDGLHVGHIRSNTAMDIISHKRRVEGFNVLYPIGWDAFGLPTENYAIKTGIQPAIVTKKNTATFTKQLKALGFSFDWSREINTTDPNYYKWTQWIFLQFLKKGLAYKKKMTINWCPKDLIGLANEEVVNGLCERCGTPVEKREKEQWMLAITKYADRLDKDLDSVDYLERIKIQQRNWIGKSEGAEVDFRLAISNEKPRFVVIHGFGGSAKTNFIPWLKKELESQGHEVETPELPNSRNPHEDEQVEYVIKNCKFDENTVVIGHSLGAIVAMKVLMKLNRPISGLVIVAAARDPKFYDAPDTRSYPNNFKWSFDFENIRKLTSGRIAVMSDTQEKERMPYLKYLAHELQARLVETTGNEEHFCAKEEPEILKVVTPSVTVFTTRPDTLFGVTYMVLAPENPWVRIMSKHIENKKEVDDYIANAKKKKDIERTDAGSLKTGVELKGIKAINPATNEEIPVWIADYVLADYGTGAVMAVPAHDERDWDFAKKYNLPIKYVIANYFLDESDPPRPGLPLIPRKAVGAFVRNPKDGKFLLLEWKKAPWRGAITGGIENNENPIDAARREIHEETGYKNLKFIQYLGNPNRVDFYHPVKNVNRAAEFTGMFFDLENEERDEVSAKEKENHEAKWFTHEEAKKFLNTSQLFFSRIGKENLSFTGNGKLVNSGKFNDKDSSEIKKEITTFVGGKWVTNFKLRDWIFSRQRYWGEPIPVVHCEKCGIVPVPEKDLPVKLPKVKNYKPTETGESPLASISKWVNTKCPNCNGKAKRETDTMPNWAGSSWYYLRYTDPKNKKAFAGAKNLKYWTPVDWYNGGMEHTTLHLLYSRFWHKFLFDQGLVPTNEPYQKRTSHGLILAQGGEKMSKSKGNVVNPDDIVKVVGADALRVYEMFMGPFDQPIAWDTNNIAGSRRFIERVWKLQEKISKAKSFAPSAKTEAIIHKTIKKVSDDIEDMKFNTAISTMMIAINELERETEISKAHYGILVKLLSPFAPHVTEELWAVMGNKKSVHIFPWPSFDPKKVIESEVKIVIQINGKMRGEFFVPTDTSDKDLQNMALNKPEIQKWTGGKELKKVIIVKGKLINIVV